MMNHDAHKTEKISFLVVVAERKQKDALLTALLDEGIRLINTVYGKGTVNENYFLTTFGLVPERNKAVILCVSTRVKAQAALDMLTEKFDFEKPNTGIAFTMPVDKVCF